MKSLSVIPLISILILSLEGLTVKAWTNEEFEMFDLVEELNSANFYEFLGVAHDATLKEIKSAYRQLSVKYHPDKNPDDPNAAVRFRQLVGVYEALKDDDLRKSYHQVLEFGLPNWRQPMFYFRRARKLAMWQVGILLLVIITIGQYLAAWGSYFEKRLSLEEMVQSRLRKTQRTKRAQKEGRTVDEVTAELESQFLKKPSLWNTAPIQLLRLGKYMIMSFPFDLVAYIVQVQKEQKEKKEMELEIERLRVEEEENNAILEPKKPRKRKTFQVPEKMISDEDVQEGTIERRGENSGPQQSNFICGGLWTDDDITMLIKLSTKYPGGFPDRWGQISNIMERPVNEVTHMAKRVMEDLSKKQAEDKEESVPIKIKVKTKASKLDDSLAEKIINWTKEEQKRLEMALQMYPKGGAGDRWTKIASHVGKSKEECMERFKYVAQLVKKKKEKAETEGVGNEAQDVPPVSDSNCEPGEVSKTNIKQEQSTTVNLNSATSDSSMATKQNENSSSSNNSGSEHDWCIVDDGGK